MPWAPSLCGGLIWSPATIYVHAFEFCPSLPLICPPRLGAGAIWSCRPFDAAVKKLIRSAKKRGYVTHDQINSVLPSEQVNSEQIEDVLAMFSEMGVNVVETEEPSEEGESEGGELVEVQQKVPAKSEAKEPTERTDDPVRMYLREMGSVELLSREGEIAIAKRIEAGREAMIAGLCESPLTFQA